MPGLARMVGSHVKVVVTSRLTANAAAGDPVHGCSVHFVTAGVDEGPVIGRAEVDVKPGDTTETLAARVLKAEHLLYPRCVAAVAAGWDGLSQFERVDVEGDVVRLTVPR